MLYEACRLQTTINRPIKKYNYLFKSKWLATGPATPNYTKWAAVKSSLLLKIEILETKINIKCSNINKGPSSDSEASVRSENWFVVLPDIHTVQWKSHLKKFGDNVEYV